MDITAFQIQPNEIDIRLHLCSTHNPTTSTMRIHSRTVSAVRSKKKNCYNEANCYHETTAKTTLRFFSYLLFSLLSGPMMAAIPATQKRQK